jgi:hypothetical protein
MLGWGAIHSSIRVRCRGDRQQAASSVEEGSLLLHLYHGCVRFDPITNGFAVAIDTMKS